jgi:hypothetical protein
MTLVRNGAGDEQSVDCLRALEGRHAHAPRVGPQTSSDMDCLGDSCVCAQRLHSGPVDVPAPASISTMESPHNLSPMMTPSYACFDRLRYAFDAFKIFARPELMEKAGIPDGKKFVKMYSMSFMCCKLATVFLVVLGHIPELAGCGEEEQSFKGTREMLLNRDGSSTIECGVCLSNNRTVGPHRDACWDLAPSTYYRCTTTCAKLFFSGGAAMPITLDVFVLVPILWLPFMVYSNNEVARVIDGIWERRRSAQHADSGGPVRISTYL